MFHKLNPVVLRRKSKIFLPEFKGYYDLSEVDATKGQVAAVIANISSLGYVVSPELIKRMMTFEFSQLVEFHDWLISELKLNLGASKSYKPMYPNFPKQVAEASDAELYINAIMHYCGDLFGMRIMPEYEVEERPALVEKLRKLKPLGFIEDPNCVFDELLGSKSSPSDQDKIDIRLCLALNTPLTITEIPTKETLAFTLAWAMRGQSPLVARLKPLCKTSVDVLRVAVALSEGDVSLSDDSKLISFKRGVRRDLLEMLDAIRMEQCAEDMMRFREKFKRLGERLHPGEFKSRFPNAYEAFRLIRNEGAETFNSKVEAALRGKEKRIKFVSHKGDQDTLLSLLVKRPGDFARRLDHTLRVSEDKGKTLDAFAKVAKEVSTPVLWQVYSHFNGRDILCAQDERVFFPKGSTTHPLVAVNELEPMGDHGVRAAQIAIEAIHENYKTRTPLGKVYVDPMCDKLLVPMSNRSAQAMLRQAGRGSRFALDKDKSTVRLFMYWKDQEGRRVDLDLSAIMFDKDWNFIGHCSWTNLRSGEGMYHSGDITSAPRGAAEFLDINLKALPKNAAYVCSTIYSFTGQKFADLDVAFAGWMSRERPNSGEIFEPKTVEGRVDLRSPSTSAMPLVIDVKAHDVIWADMTIARSGWGLSVHNTKGATSLSGKAISKLAWMRPSLMNVIDANVAARGGSFVDKREDADLIIAEDGHISPFDVAQITSQLL